MVRLGIRKFRFFRAIVPTQLGLLALLSFGVSATLAATAEQIAQAPVVTPAPSAPTTPVGTTILYVNPTTGNDQASAGRTDAAPYRTLSFALQQASAGTVVQLAPGSYTSQTGEQFPIVIPAGVIVRGNETSKGQNILIQGNGTTSSKTFGNQSIAIRLNTGSELRGVTVTNTATRGSGVWVEDADATIANSTFTSNNREGIFVTGNSNPTVTDNVFTKNPGNGMSIVSGARGLVKDNVFLDTGFGLAIGGDAIPRLEGNQITQNQTGIVLSGSARPILRNNVISDSQGDGITVLGSSFPDLGTSDSLGNNTIRNNGKNASLKGVDVNNTTSNTIQAVGNSIDPKKIAGLINFVAGGTNTAFSDVQGHWAQQQIQALAAQAIISGFPDGTFKPNDPVTRAQFAAIVLKAFSPPARTTAPRFSDVASNFWASAAIQAAAKGGFMTGFPDSTFRPNLQIPKVQALVAIANGLQYGAGNPASLSVFQDVSAIPSWATSQVAAATQRQVVVNYPTVGQLNPDRAATRAEVAATIYQALVNAGKAQAIPSPYVVGAR
jgi:parallel beta-helix repeat protein